MRVAALDVNGRAPRARERESERERERECACVREKLQSVHSFK
jgi:hypothetical protein